MSSLKISASLISEICEHLLKNKALIITTGAGMSVDSGLPDFRGPKGFYKSYPQFEEMMLNFEDIANPNFFLSYPKKAWYFYGHRFNLYKETTPHLGYKMLHEIGKKVKEDNYIVITSNVDGHFIKGGFPLDKVIEIHGNINYFQCNYCDRIKSANELGIEKFELNNILYEIVKIPRCNTCEGMLRPNILLFEDNDYIFDRFYEQNKYFMDFMEKNKKEGITIIEIGAGIDVDKIRSIGENFLFKDQYPATLIRINPRIENLIIKEMLERGIITKERYNDYMDGEDIDIEKELEELSKDDNYETSDFLRLKTSQFVEQNQQNVKYVKKLLNFEKGLFNKSNNKLINLKSTGLNAISEIYSNLSKLQKI